MSVSLRKHLGAHRVLEPPGSLPQAAWKLDNDFSAIDPSELRVAVDVLNLDAASFRQIEEAAAGDLDRMAETIRHTVASRGKQHNPVTGSGGMLLGRIAEIGREVQPQEATVGDRIASLVSLTLTPLRLTAIRDIDRRAAQVRVEGEAVLFASSPYAVVPADLPERLVLAALDVAGAAPQVARLVKPGDAVLVVGAGGKSGVLCAMEARRRAGAQGRVIGIESSGEAARELDDLGVCDAVIERDARDPLGVLEGALGANNDREYDVAISCVNVQGAEMSVVLPTRDGGIVYFFAMSTSFTAAALGAEGAGKDVDLRIGNGYAAGHALHTLDMLRNHDDLRALFESRYAPAK